MWKWRPGAGGCWSYGSLVLLAIKRGCVLFCCWAETEINYAFIAPSETMSYCWQVTEGSIITHISMWQGEMSTRERTVRQWGIQLQKIRKIYPQCNTFLPVSQAFPFKSLLNTVCRVSILQRITKVLTVYWGKWVCVPSFMPIPPIAVEAFYSKPHEWSKSQGIIKLTRIHHLDTINIWTKLCANPSSRSRNIHLYNWKPAGGATGKVRGTPKRPRVSVWNFKAIHPIAVGIFQSGPKRWTNR